MARRRSQRARRRIAARTAKNALALETAIAVEEERLLKLKRARHVEQLALLEGRGALTSRQRTAQSRPS